MGGAASVVPEAEAFARDLCYAGPFRFQAMALQKCRRGQIQRLP
jgi:hypothetical protein